MQSEERLRAIERYTDLPLLILALVMVPLLIVPAVTELPRSWHSAFLVADWFIWAAFAADFAVKIVVAPRRLIYVRTHWLEAAMVVLPFLRPLRLLRFLRLVRLATVLGVNIHLLHAIVAQRGTKVIVAAVLGTLLSGSTAVFLAERNSDGANITSFGDALWWGATTMTTVGYGDTFPTTPMGRGIGVALMILGIAALSALTATIAAAFLVQERNDSEKSDFVAIMTELRTLRAELAELKSGRDAESAIPQ